MLNILGIIIGAVVIVCIKEQAEYLYYQKELFSDYNEFSVAFAAGAIATVVSMIINAIF